MASYRKMPSVLQYWRHKYAGDASNPIPNMTRADKERYDKSASALEKKASRSWDRSESVMARSNSNG